MADATRIPVGGGADGSAPYDVVIGHDVLGELPATGRGAAPSGWP